MGSRMASYGGTGMSRYLAPFTPGSTGSTQSMHTLDASGIYVKAVDVTNRRREYSYLSGAWAVKGASLDEPHMGDWWLGFTDTKEEAEEWAAEWRLMAALT